MGSVENYTLENNDSYTVDVRLFNDMTNLSHVYVIKNKNKQEIIQLQLSDDAE